MNIWNAAAESQQRRGLQADSASRLLIRRSLVRAQVEEPVLTGPAAMRALCRSGGILGRYWALPNIQWFAPLLALSLAACGGGGSSIPSASPGPVEYVPAAKLVVIGNSITRHGPAPSIGWTGDQGMAASSAATDYAHLVADELRAGALAASNFADLERNPADAINVIDLDTPVAHQISQHAAEVTPASVVVVQLGDNAPRETMSTFGPAYGALLDAVAVRQTLVCVSTWWRDDAKDAVIRGACEAHGGRFVFIGDIHADPANRDRIEGPQYSNPGVQDHPHDWSMSRISERVLAALER